jgi:hypothetical protein
MSTHWFLIITKLQKLPQITAHSNKPQCIMNNLLKHQSILPHMRRRVQIGTHINLHQMNIQILIHNKIKSHELEKMLSGTGIGVDLFIEF